jgi:hypothetical protein
MFDNNLKIKQTKQDGLQEMTFKIPQGTILFQPHQPGDIEVDDSMNAGLDSSSVMIDPQ